MKMTLFAFAAKCGFFGASGLAKLVLGGAAVSESPNNPASATAPKPPPISQRNSRRVRPQNWRGAFITRSTLHCSIQIHKLIRIQHQQTILLQRFGGADFCPQGMNERDVLLHFLVAGLACRG